jgi:hypothetical protein
VAWPRRIRVPTPAGPGMPAARRSGIGPSDSEGGDAGSAGRPTDSESRTSVRVRVSLSARRSPPGPSSLNNQRALSPSQAAAVGLGTSRGLWRQCRLPGPAAGPSPRPGPASLSSCRRGVPSGSGLRVSRCGRRGGVHRDRPRLSAAGPGRPAPAASESSLRLPARAPAVAQDQCNPGLKTCSLPVLEPENNDS